jgi:hypothetical protein
MHKPNLGVKLVKVYNSALIDLDRARYLVILAYCQYNDTGRKLYISCA